MNDDLTIDEAADSLNVSRLYLVDLLKTGALPSSLCGCGAPRPCGAPCPTKKQIDAQRRKALDELAAEAQELGLGW